MIGVSPRTLWLELFFSCDCTFWDYTGFGTMRVLGLYGCWDYRGGGLTRQPVGPLVDTAATTTVTSIYYVDSGSFSSRCCTFRRTHTSADPIRLHCIPLALPLTLSLPSRLVSGARLSVGVPPRVVWLAGIFLLCRKKRCASVVGTRAEWVLKEKGGGMMTPLLQYVAWFDGGGDIVGFGWGSY